MKLLICHFSTHMQYLLMTKYTSRNRTRTDELLLNICSPISRRAPRRSERLDPSLFFTHPPQYLQKGTLKEQVVLVTHAVKFFTDAHLHHLNQQGLVVESCGSCLPDVTHPTESEWLMQSFHPMSLLRPTM